MKKFIKEYLSYIITIIVVLIIKLFIVSPIRVIGDSMKSTLLDKDIMLLDKISYRFKDIKRYDIVVIDSGRSHIIKRVIGLPGDSIKIFDNEVYVNDKKIKEDYLDKNIITTNYDLEKYLGTNIVPKDSYFVLGDNREVSADSRSIGFINKKEIQGHATFTLFPFSRFGEKK